MPRAVRFDGYGGVDVLRVVDVERPVPGPDEVLVRVRAAGINPGESAIREGLLDAMWPATFPSGQGSDLAGVVEERGERVRNVAVGEEVIGYTDRRASHAEYVAVPAANVTPRPPGVPWEAAGALPVVGTTAYAAVRAVGAGPGDTVVVAGAAGGVGTLAAQLARSAGATVIGLAGPHHDDWLAAHGITPVAYGEGVADRVRRAAGDGVPNAFIDTFGADYVRMAVEDLGVRPERVDTLINHTDAERYGTRTDGNAQGASADVLAELAARIADGDLEVPVARTYPLEQVRDAYRELERRHTLGKIVLVP
ncbi:NADP-dependent oxidoreductase [Streptomyces sp. CMB-StM0423]|uniref:NADP-dependent oxidoreductase n=1 Tax=Streptomyces sp. CMB-StM0423 TaxID=2059884 RepID=UPI000C70E568|nr:NADP-dependent oxidoreductase [Streptomyces sp. CMB-StM0423]AUH39634.1 NADPH:quinone reductase [Streptomyces sp. CMB-StM0423]